MALELLHTRLEAEIKPINAALGVALLKLPSPCQPVAKHVIKAGGKRLRPFLTVLCARMLGDASSDIYSLGACMEMLHAATLLHDDVLDNADTRRGTPAAHTIYGSARAILAGDALLALGNSIVASFANSTLSECYSRATMQTASGEILEMNSLHNPNLSAQEYLEIAKGKTGCLIAQSCVMGAAKANATAEQIVACQIYGENLGVAFQLVDDALDFSPQSQTGKPSGGDLREGKLTPPLRLYRDSLAPLDREKFNAAFAKVSFSQVETMAITEAVLPFAAISLDDARLCILKAKQALAILPQGEENDILMQMADYILQRKN